jgi:hypothetical protein
VKLYGRFKQVVDKLRQESKLIRAWFTSFNLSPYFVENYILPALVGDPSCPVKSIGFEALFQKILQNEIDVRFFYDHRAIDLSESKRTVVRFCPVDPQALQPGTGIPFGRGVFHPKIIFLQNERGTSWLFASSANLTVAGWSRNREAVLDREVCGRENFNRITEFFEAIAGERIIDDSSLASRRGQDNWEFVHSIGEASFLDRLLGDHPRNLYIWSPYFAGDLCQLLEEEIFSKMSGDATVGIIPDIENERIRVAESQRESLKCLGNVHFFREDAKSHKIDSPQMSHAKVWLSETRLAVGSWNLTGAALGLSANYGGRNVEAGIITPIGARIYNGLKPHESLDLDGLGFMTTEELKRDRRFLMAPLPFQIQVYRNWRHDRYEISLGGKTPTSVYTIRLPGVAGDRRLRFSESEQLVSISDTQRALKEHIFSVFQRDALEGEEPYRGMIIDLEPGYRPVWRYSSFNDLLQAWAQNQAGVEGSAQYSDSYELAYADSIDHQYKDDETGDSFGKPLADITFSYYTMFSAFENIRERLQSEQMDSPEKLQIILKTQPGSLFEISDKTRKVISNPDVSVVYKWFLQEELNNLLRIAQLKSSQLGEDTPGQVIGKKILREIKDQALFDQYGQCGSNWIKHIRKVSGYRKTG